MDLHAIVESSVSFLVNLAAELGYLGVFIGMFLESTVFPLPSELIMIPAGMAAAQGLMNLYLAIFFGVLGNLLGAIFSYYLAISLGRSVLLKIGKYFFFKPKTIIKIEKFFNNHGEISVFIGRLILGFRHFISLPAGLARMNIKHFCLYTTLGSLVWTSVLTILGYFIGKNQEMIKEYLHLIIMVSIIFCGLLIAVYIYFKRRKNLVSTNN